MYTQTLDTLDTQTLDKAIFPKLFIMSDNIKFLARIERMKVGEGGDTHSSVG